MSTQTEARARDGAFFACCRAAEFPAQALLRIRPEFRRQAIAVLDMEETEPRVCAGNARSRRRGLKNGMTGAEAELCGALALGRRPDLEQSAQAVMLATAASFTPQTEVRTSEAAVVSLLHFSGGQGTASLALARTLRAAMRLCGFHTSVALSADFYTAYLLAHGKPGIAMAAPGSEQTVLAPLLLSACAEALALEDDQVQRLASRGVHTLGAAAMLSQKQLVEEFGPAGKRLRELARGEHSYQVPLAAIPSPGEAARLEAVLARLTTLVGEGRVGSPVLRRGPLAGTFGLHRFHAARHEPAPRKKESERAD